MLDIKKSNISIDNQSVISENALLDLLFCEAPDAIFILEAKNYAILNCNEKAIEFFEAENKSSLAGMHSFRLFDSETTEFSRNILEMNIRKEGEHIQEMVFRTLKRNVFWGKMKIRVYNSDKKEYILLRIIKTVDYLKTEEILSALFRGTARVTGHKFLKELTRLLCSTFSVNYSFVGKISDDKKYLHIVESSNEVNNVDLEKYIINASLFENVIRGYTTFYPKGVKDLFPDDKCVKDNKIESFMGAPVFGNSGEVLGLIGIMNNEPMQEIPNSRYILSIFASRTATEIQRIRSKEILKEQAHDLAVSNDIKDKLLSVISHDLINPLHTIMGFSELLRSKIDKYEKDKIIERVEIIDNSIRNIYFMLDNLISWSNFCRHNVKMTRDFIFIDEVIEENISLFKHIIEIKKLTIDITGKSAITIYSDKRMVSSIIRNILSNAVKYTPKHGEITIKVRENRSNITLTIEDNGTGFAPEDLKAFRKADKDNPDLLFSGKKSSGMGLLLSQLHVERIGGSLKISSSPNIGTSIKISIPKG